MRGADLKLPLVTAVVFAVLGAAWFFAAAYSVQQNRVPYLVSALAFIVIGALTMFAVVQRGVSDQRDVVEELVGREQRSTKRRQRLDILWRFAGSEGSDFVTHATAALEVSARVLGLEAGEAAHVDGEMLLYDLFYERNVENVRPEPVPLSSGLGSLPIAAGSTVAFADVEAEAKRPQPAQIRQRGARAYIGTPFTVGSVQYELGFWSSSPRALAFDDEDYEYVQVLAGFFSGLFRQRRQEEELAHLALFDSLTGLANRSNLLDRLRGSIAAHRRRSAQCALLVVDVNRFKQINDVLGVAAGDAALIELAGRLKGVLRAEDSLARVGGDQFAVITSLMRSPGEVVALADRLREAAAEPLKLDGHTFHISTSIGISVFPTDGQDPKAMLDHALAAANRSKEEGAGKYMFYSSEISQNVRARQELFSDLRNAVEIGEFALHFQPQIDLRTGTTVGAEALLRWQHTRRGLIGPGAFVPAAEEHGLMIPIGSWVMQEALLQWRALLQNNAGIHVAINVSAPQFSDPQFYERLNEAITSAQVPAQRVVIEITESIAMADPRKTRTLLLQCKELGLMVALDDFGTLYSSLAYLKTLPIDIIKIDKSFVDGLPNDRFDAAIVHAVISLANALGCTIVAEGVEKVEQAEWLADAGVQAAQGFLYSKGVPYDQFVTFLSEPAQPHGATLIGS